MSSASGYQTELSITLSTKEKELLKSSIQRLIQERDKINSEGGCLD